MMPVCTGLQFAQIAMSHLCQYARPIFYALTATQLDEDRQLLRRAGCTVLTKPVKYEVLKTLLHSVPKLDHSVQCTAFDECQPFDFDCDASEKTS